MAGYLIIALLAIGFAWVECEMYGVKEFFMGLLILAVVVGLWMFAMYLIEGKA